VLSSVSEGFPNTVAEAMACGVPCVVTDVGDAACIVADTGVIVGPHDDSAMTQAIDQCLQQMPSPEWQDKGMAAREHVISHFSLCKMVSEYARIYRRLTK